MDPVWDFSLGERVKWARWHASYVTLYKGGPVDKWAVKTIHQEQGTCDFVDWSEYWIYWNILDEVWGLYWFEDINWEK